MAAGPARGSLEVSDIRFDKQGDNVTLAFDVAAGKKSVRNGAHLVITPVLASEGHRKELPLIVVKSKSSRALNESAGNLPAEALAANTLYVYNNSTESYSANLRFEEWMQGADLVFEGADIQCCSEMEMSPRTIASNILNLGSGKYEFVVTEAVYHAPEQGPSTGDLLAGRYSFIAPLVEFAPSIGADGGLTSGHSTSDAYANTEVGRAEADRYIDNNQEGALIIYFRRGAYEADPSFSGNEASLQTLYKAVREIYDSPDSEVSHVIIAGFASPEGTVKFNDRLAWNRAVVVKDLLVENTPVSSNMVSVYNGAVNWSKLRELVVESGMKGKDRVLEIIDNTPLETAKLQDNRIERLKKLDGGAPYKYMLDNLFPELRNAAFIKVYYENKSK